MLLYLATPYTRYSSGIEVAYREACSLAGELLKRGHNVYSPIAHSHGLAMYGDIDPLDLSVWLPANQSMMERCDALLVALMNGWRESVGVQHEIKWFREAGKPVRYLKTFPIEIVDEA